MHIQISGQHLPLTPALRERINAKSSRLDRLYHNTAHLAVVLSVSKQEQRADATLAVAGRTLRAEASGSNLYDSIDRLFERLSRQLRKYRTQLLDRHQREVRMERYS